MVDDVTQFCIEEAAVDCAQVVDAMAKSRGNAGEGPLVQASAAADAMAVARAELARVEM